MAETLTVTLRADTARELEAIIERGAYASTGEIIAEALADWLRKQAERKASFESLKADIEIGLRDLEAGRTVAFDAEGVIARGRQRLAQRSTSG